MSRLTRSLPALAAAAVVGAGAVTAGALADGGHRHPAHHGAYSAFDEQYLQTAIEGDRFEITGGELAQQQGSTQAVKDYGARLVKDHSTSLKDAKALARRLGIDVPKAPSPSMQWELRTVGSFSGAQFDAAYADLEAKDHQQDISESQDEVSDGYNRRVRHLAKSDLPTLREHLAIAEQLGGRQGEDPTG